MRYELEVLCAVYGDMLGYGYLVSSILEWMRSQLPYLNMVEVWRFTPEQPSLAILPVAGLEGMWGKHLVPEGVDWPSLPAADIVLLLWKCPPDWYPAAAGYTWAAGSHNGRRCVVVSVPYRVPWDNHVAESRSGFNTGFEVVIAHELKNALVKLAEFYRLPVLNTYDTVADYFDCGKYVLRRECYAAVLAQFDEAMCKIITGGKPEKPPAFDWVDQHDPEGRITYYHTDYVWDGSAWQRVDTLVKEG